MEFDQVVDIGCVEFRMWLNCKGMIFIYQCCVFVKIVVVENGCVVGVFDNLILVLCVQVNGFFIKCIGLVIYSLVVGEFFDFIIKGLCDDLMVKIDIYYWDCLCIGCVDEIFKWGNKWQIFVSVVF